MSGNKRKRLYDDLKGSVIVNFLGTDPLLHVDGSYRVEVNLILDKESLKFYVTCHFTLHS